MILNDEDRQKFIAWLQRDIESSKTIWEQAKKGIGPHWQVIAKHIEQEMAAEIVVCRKLMGTESLTISG
jgi:hypothetical protein